ncbi:MAG: hypothetical protein HDR13_01720 [Lachnospiraceae bacterium]|nr:hypothetical protein [Lachnospiraceae bacterium]
MEMADFNGYEQNQRMYGGTAGSAEKNYHTVIEYRYDKVFLPLYQKIIGRKKGCEAEEV